MPSTGDAGAGDAIWIKTPLAIMADGGAGGLVIRDGVIVELVSSGGSPATRCAAVFDASRHVVIPGLVNTHHHMFQTLTRAHPAALNKSLWPWIESLYPIWVQHLSAEGFRIASRLAMVELMMSGCTCTCDHHYLFSPASRTPWTSRPGKPRRSVFASL